jgi:hypothetical protein
MVRVSRTKTPIVSYNRKTVDRDKRGKVICMRKLKLAYSGRNVAAPIAAACSSVVGHFVGAGSG